MAKSSSSIGASSLDFLRAPLRRTEAMTGDWLDSTKAHHQMLAEEFDELIACSPEDRAVRYKRLAYLLTAHSVAEENAVYPALAMCGLQTESDRLYLDEAHAKVQNAMLDMADDRLGDRWLERAKTLRDDVLKHAEVDEEGELYPQLQAALDAGMQAKLTSTYLREFLSVSPT